MQLYSLIYFSGSRRDRQRRSALSIFALLRLTSLSCDCRALVGLDDPHTCRPDVRHTARTEPAVEPYSVVMLRSRSSRAGRISRRSKPSLLRFYYTYLSAGSMSGCRAQSANRDSRPKRRQWSCALCEVGRISECAGWRENDEECVRVSSCFLLYKHLLALLSHIRRSLDFELIRSAEF
ncbi:hypothetical protein DFH11DRAFT_1231885 [Phellopilus nigrolimitatus]|nr:hypothetical protein DFH11DRAFT_270009 [Phellopilus nigrolimitatus]KAH8106620.1 hypothetical protein DFH11DRAFT_1231885 [Phellopilus nigrolimitatus]